jgi:predicted permease
MRRGWDRLLSAAASLRFRVWALLHRRALDRDLEAELRHHLELRAEREVAGGLSLPAARRAAALRFGGYGSILADARDASRFVLFADFVADTVHGVRLLRRNPVSACVTVMILALGIGINVWIFSTMQALLFRPVPGIDAPDRLVAIGRTQDGAGFDTQSYPNAEALRERNLVLSDLAVYSDITVGVEAQSQTARVRGARVSANFFDVLGAAMAQGRGFSAADDGGARVAVVSEDFWRPIFGPGATLASDVTIRVNRVPFQVVGVAPTGFRGLAAGSPVDIWLPLGAMDRRIGRSAMVDEALTNRAVTWLWTVGRLKAGVSFAEARVSLRSLGDRLAAEFPAANSGRGVAVEPVGGIGPLARARLQSQWLLLNGLSGLVLLVVCFNVANMTVARASSRRQEMALRLSLGAGRLRLVRQVLAEHTVVALAGGVGGALIAWGGAKLLLAALPPGLLSLTPESLAPDWRAFAFAAAAAFAAGAMFSVPAALTAARTPVMTLLRTGTGHGWAPARLRTAFAVLQVSLSLALLTSGALLGRSLREATAVDLGFEARGVVTAYYDLEEAGYGAADGAQVHAQLLERLRAWGAVDVAALGQHAPLQGSSLGLPIEIDGGRAGGGRTQLVRVNVVSPDYFAALRTPLRRGREFHDDDRAAAPPVALVNETCRRVCFGGDDPLGRSILVFRESGPREIVGVVADTKYSQPLEDVRPTIYLPVAQRYSPRMAILLRTSSPAAVVRALAGEVRRVDTALPVYDVLTLDDRAELALWQPRLSSVVVGGFGMLTLLLAVLGVYGLVAQTTSQRAPEIAVRMALGASPGTVVSMVLRQGLWLVATGMVIGLCAAVALAALLKSFLYNVGPFDPASFGFAIAVLGSFTLAGCVVPAWRAAAANPGVVLRR